MYMYLYVYLYMSLYTFRRVRQECWDLQDGERSLRRAKSGNIMVDARGDTDL